MVNTALPNVSAAATEHSGMVKKPRLLIFDDTAGDLTQALSDYRALGYDAIGVMVYEDTLFVKPDATVVDVLAARQPTPNALFDRSNLATLLEKFEPDAVLSDKNWQNPNFASGHELVKAIQQLRPSLPCVVHSFKNQADGKVTTRDGIAMASKFDAPSVIGDYLHEQIAPGRRY